MNRLEKVLAGIVALLVVALVGLMAVSWLQPAGRTADAAPTGNTPLTAKSAYTMALPLARAWAEDATLLNAHVTWPEDRSFPAGAASHSFTFYSPGREATALIAVNDARPRLLSTREPGRAMHSGDLGQWQIDSPDVVAAVLANGGQAFLEANGRAGLVLTLDVGEQVVWKSTLANSRTRQTLILQFDPESGAPLTPAGASP